MSSPDERPDALKIAAERHRWVLEYRRLCADLGMLLPFERVRVESLESAESGERLTDKQIAERVQAAALSRGEPW